MSLVRLTDCDYATRGTGNGLSGVSFALSPGEVVILASDNGPDARLFLRALASLEKPLSGRFFHWDRELSFDDYRHLLPYKSKVGYIAADAALFGNRTLGENLVFAAHYFGAPPGDPEDEILALCDYFGIRDKLSQRPAAASPAEARLALAVREITKGPEIILVDRPGQDLSRERFEKLLEVLEQRRSRGAALVIHQPATDFFPGPERRRVHIAGGRLLEGKEVERFPDAL
ncbi:MAG: hypothetical protein KKA60_00180 [Proteobacteria bacterium]|nr:hypothetical protein [Pseudomonadota bacterium]